MRKYIYVLFACLLMGLPQSELQAEPTQCINQMLDRIQSAPPATDSIWWCSSVDRGFGIRVRRNSDGDISHLGLRIFSPQMRKVNDPIICDCLERLMLNLSIEEAKPLMGIRAWAKNQGIEFNVNGYGYGRGSFKGMNNFFDVVRNALQIEVREEERNYKFIVTSRQDQHCTLSFLKDRSLIWGTDKYEEDHRIAKAIAKSQGNGLPDIKLDQSESYTAASTDGYFQRKGAAYLIDRLRATTYYSNNGPDAKACFDAEHPELALTNLMLMAAGSPDIMVNLTHSIYGLTPIVSQKRWGDLMTALAGASTQLYAAAHCTKEGDKVTGVLVLYNAHYDYIDMLMISATMEELFDKNHPQIAVTLYTNVPQNNVKSLFED